MWFNKIAIRLGMFSDTPVIKRGNLLDTLCATLEEKMQFLPGERDMVMLQHKFEVELKDGTRVCEPLSRHLRSVSSFYPLNHSANTYINRFMVR